MQDIVPTYRESLKITDEEFTEMGRVGAMFFEQGNLHKARTIFEGLVEMNPESAEAHSALGAILALNQQDQDAIEHLEQAIGLDPLQIAPYVNLGEVQLRHMKLEVAIESLKKAIALDKTGDDPGAKRARALILGIHRVIKFEDGGAELKH